MKTIVALFKKLLGFLNFFKKAVEVIVPPARTTQENWDRVQTGRGLIRYELPDGRVIHAINWRNLVRKYNNLKTDFIMHFEKVCNTGWHSRHGWVNDAIFFDQFKLTPRFQVDDNIINDFPVISKAF